MGFKYVVDTNRGLVQQVGKLGSDYDKWLHQPINSKASPKLYDNKFIELLTLTPWWLVPVLWLPFVAWNFVVMLRRDVDPITTMFVILLGLFLWTLFEYLNHRFVFHMKMRGYWGNTLHYVLHGFHHKHPMDKYRLVYPPVGVAFIYVSLSSFGRLFIPDLIFPGVRTGFLLGYVLYDVFHYYIHHGKPSIPIMKKLQNYHIYHHFKGEDDSYGVTTMFWDRLLGTWPASYRY
ncbi:hypothetical protein KP509_17G007700 [Ceratopteris richardii]|uniref:Fatty acid hydroxylase domain-containing protein n=1 Tax=Ceratopteris richardii TaxID=49495 RepID=A0A8T2STV3_CERRI|nr:hypothetical protein KP509_17G007700 [Ceratopteris richardii]KAH7372511.1 hypothetical protein KP509_17G007700 [Ceratopteris richardii]KAH7372512.1 hypothetical protein KP509_17G007700 [Ceratopteris richardii]